MTPILAFEFEPFLAFLVWAVLLVFNLWMWQKTKGQGNLVMMLGAGGLGLSYLLIAFESYSKFIWFWLPLIGAVLVTLGFYLTAKPIVDKEIATLKQKLHDATAKKGQGGPTNP